MNWKCFFLGHSIGKIKFMDSETGVYEWDCGRCEKTKKGLNVKLVKMLSARLKGFMVDWAWYALQVNFPQSFNGNVEDSRHTITYHPNGDVVFAVDLKPEEIAILRKILTDFEPTFSSWKIRPVLSLVES